MASALLFFVFLACCGVSAVVGFTGGVLWMLVRRERAARPVATVKLSHRANLARPW